MEHAIHAGMDHFTMYQVKLVNVIQQKVISLKESILMPVLVASFLTTLILSSTNV